MASRHVTIKDAGAAIADGTIPGAFSEDRLTFTFPTVTTLNARGATLLWDLNVQLVRRATSVEAAVPIEKEYLASPAPMLGRGYVGVIRSTSQQEGGKVKESVPTRVLEGKNIGKANATNVITQALRDALGRYNKQLKRSDPTAVPDAAAPGAGSASSAGDDVSSPFVCMAVPEAKTMDLRPPPMLVKKLGSSGAAVAELEFKRGAIVLQRKYNGVRLVAHLGFVDCDTTRPRAILHSRTGGLYPGLESVRAELVTILSDPPPINGKTAARYGIPPALLETYAYGGAVEDTPAVFLDGEIYLHGKPLAWISGQARRDDDEGLLGYQVFDCFFPLAIALGHNMPSAGRQAYLDDLFARHAERKRVHRVENFRPASLAEANELVRGFIREGYEGGILRKSREGYRYSHNNYHSANVLKIKPVLDDEFEVVDFTQGDKGKDVGAVIWTCRVDDAHVVDPRDRLFAVVPKDMTYEARYELFKCLGKRVPDPSSPGKTVTRFERDLKGRMLTVEYAERSAKTGKPTQPKALAFRTYESEGPDPVRALYADCGIV